MIRETQKKDIPELTNVYLDIFLSEEWAYTWLTQENIRRYLTDMFSCPCAVAYTFIENGAIIGGCFGDYSNYFKNTQYYIKEIFIKKDKQRTGLGSALLNEIEADLKKRGIVSITLYTSQKIPAFNFYMKNGYTKSEDMAFMVKVLK